MHPAAVTRLVPPAGTPGLPLPGPGELSRPRLLERLQTRWEVPVTVVCAGAGFGKTTLLAQAVRANLVCPRGLETWVSCEEGYADAAQLAGAVLAALDAPPLRSDPLTAVLDALRRTAPLDGCLVLDDVHHVGAGTPAARLLGEVVRRLPATAHLVLAGRQATDLPLARLRAAGRVLDLCESDLVFTPEEVAGLAARAGREPGAALAVGGWPALVRLTLAAGDRAAGDRAAGDRAAGTGSRPRPGQPPSAGSSRQVRSGARSAERPVGRPGAGPGGPPGARLAARSYAREEVLAALPPDDLPVLAALGLVGPATAELVGRVVGRAVDLDGLTARVPLTGVLDDGRCSAHELWEDAVEASLPGAAAAELRLRAIDCLAEDGQLVRAGALAVASAAWHRLAAIALALVQSTLSITPPAVAERWLAAVPGGCAARPEFTLLRAAARHARDAADPQVDGLVDEACRSFLDRGDRDAVATALGLGIVAAHTRADLARLRGLVHRTEPLPHLRASPLLRLVVHGAAGVIAELQGDPEAALVELAQAPVDEVPDALALSVNRFSAHCLLMAGRAADAVELADRTLADGGDAHSRLIPAVARWLAGHVAGFDALRSARGTRHATGARDAFVEAAESTVLGCSAGESVPGQPVPSPEGVDDPRDAALATVCAAGLAVLRHDEQSAAAAFSRYLQRYPLDVRLGERHLRRFLGVGHVLDPTLRAHWDAVPLGPSHVAAREAARAVLAARAGSVDRAAALPPAHALCFLPLPWSVELAARLAGAGQPAGRVLAAFLADRLGPAVHAELRHCAAGPPGPAATGAGRLLAGLPAPPALDLEIRVLGPLQVRQGGVVSDRPELRRARVRELLCALVVSRSLCREQVTALLWPDLDAGPAQHNLRVTLTHLRRLLEPTRSARDASHHLRVDSEVIRLFPSAALTVDLWEHEQLLSEADSAGRAGDTHRAGELLTAATALWRGEPPSELRRSPELSGAVDAVSLRQVAAVLALGELRLVEGDPGAAAVCADRALALEPYDERAHRLGLAAAIQRRDPGAIAVAVTRTRRALTALDVAPDSATAVLLRQARLSLERVRAGRSA